MLGDVYPIAGGTPSGSQTDFPVIVSPTAPANPSKGTAWANSVANNLQVWNGSAWIVVSSSSGLPAGSMKGQVLQTGAAPGFTWGADEKIDSGRY